MSFGHSDAQSSFGKQLQMLVDILCYKMPQMTPINCSVLSNSVFFIAPTSDKNKRFPILRNLLHTCSYKRWEQLHKNVSIIFKMSGLCSLRILYQRRTFIFLLVPLIIILKMKWNEMKKTLYVSSPLPTLIHNSQY